MLQLLGSIVRFGVDGLQGLELSFEHVSKCSFKSLACCICGGCSLEVSALALELLSQGKVLLVILD